MVNAGDTQLAWLTVRAMYSKSAHIQAGSAEDLAISVHLKDRGATVIAFTYQITLGKGEADRVALPHADGHHVADHIGIGDCLA